MSKKLQNWLRGTSLIQRLVIERQRSFVASGWQYRLQNVTGHSLEIFCYFAPQSHTQCVSVASLLLRKKTIWNQIETWNFNSSWVTHVVSLNFKEGCWGGRGDVLVSREVCLMSWYPLLQTHSTVPGRDSLKQLDQEYCAWLIKWVATQKVLLGIKWY